MPAVNCPALDERLTSRNAMHIAHAFLIVSVLMPNNRLMSLALVPRFDRRSPRSISRIAFGAFAKTLSGSIADFPHRTPGAMPVSIISWILLILLVQSDGVQSAGPWGL